MLTHKINLYKDSNLLDKIIVEGLVRHQAVLEDDLPYMQLVCEGQIINEKIYRDEIFRKLYGKLQESDRHMFTTEELSEYFPLNTRIHRKLKKHSPDLNKLYVSVCGFDLSSLFLELRHWSNSRIENELVIKKCEEIQKIVKETTDGFFTKFGKNRLFGIMFLNKNKLSIQTLKHEFIHYYSWMSGNISDIYSADESFYEEEFGILQKYFGITGKDFRYITQDNEYETLLNTFLDLLKTVKEKFFPDLNGHAFAVKMSEDLFIRRDLNEIETWENYLERVKKLEYFPVLKGNSSFIMFIAYNIFDEKLLNIKNHIFGCFSYK